MGFTRYYSAEHNFMLTKITGEIDDNGLMSHVISLNKETSGLVNLRELADCREITKINLTTQGTVISASKEQDKPGSRGVILVPESYSQIWCLRKSYSNNNPVESTFF